MGRDARRGPIQRRGRYLSGVTAVDPVLAGIEQDIANIQQSNGPRGEITPNIVRAPGKTGLSQLSEMKADAELSTGLGRGRVFARASAVTIDAGAPPARAWPALAPMPQSRRRPSSTGCLATGQCRNPACSGVAVSGGYADKLVKIEGGTTPIGMGQTKAVWHAEVTPQLSDHSSARAWFERKPVTDSVVSYAGTRDPVTGKRWGQVMSMGGGGGYSYDKDGNGVYGDVSYHSYRGDNVLANHNVEVNAGGYIKAWGNDRAQLTAGVNVNYQAYGNNQNQFTYGQGGYFSPQSFLALSFPINYHYQYRKVEAKAGVTPGFQSFSQNQTDLYPTDAAAGHAQRGQGRGQRRAQLLRQPEQDRLRHLGHRLALLHAQPRDTRGRRGQLQHFRQLQRIPLDGGHSSVPGEHQMRLAYNSSDPTLALVDDMPMLDDPMQHGMALIAALTMGEVFEAASLPQARGFYRSVGAKMAAAHPIPPARPARVAGGGECLLGAAGAGRGDDHAGHRVC
jgi:hypothetical protein